MAAAGRKPDAPPLKKRKVQNDAQPLSGSPTPNPKKRSILFDKPQNYYAPPSVSSMTKEELIAWRKEQRKKRNRESAATSRNKHRSKTEELEGEVDRWKEACRDMEMRLDCMERHVMFLTKLNGCGRQGAGDLLHSPPLPVVSHPASPSGSPPPAAIQLACPSRSPPSSPHTLVVPNTVTSLAPPLPAFSSHRAAHLFPSLLSDSKDSISVEILEAAAAAVSDKEPRKHLTLIPRQA